MVSEPKCADANGEPANKQPIGLLHRRHITIDHIITPPAGGRVTRAGGVMFPLAIICAR